MREQDDQFVIQTPPHAIEAEQAIIGGLLRDNGAVDRMGDLRPAQFYRQDHRDIFTEIIRQIGSGQPCDVVTVSVAMPKLVEGMRYLNDMAQSTPSAANIGRHADVVRDRALRRGLLAATSEMSELAFKPGAKSAVEVLDVAQSKLAALAETRMMREPKRANEVLVGYAEMMCRREEGGEVGIPTGFKDFDRMLNGGMKRGNLIIIGARPSMGKSALAQNIAVNVSDEYASLFCSMEMQEYELMDRAIASVGCISLDSVICGKMSQEQWNSYTASNIKISSLNFFIDDQPALTILDVRSKARQVKRKQGLDLVVVDYLQLMSGNGDNRNSQIEEISRGLKALAKELGIAVIALSQLNRSIETRPNKRPLMSDLRDSGAIEQDADVIAFLYRDEVYDPNTHLRGFADLIVAKNRQGAIGDVLLEYEGQYTRFCTTTRHRPEPKERPQRRGLAAAL